MDTLTVGNTDVFSKVVWGATLVEVATSISFVVAVETAVFLLVSTGMVTVVTRVVFVDNLRASVFVLGRPVN